MLAHQDRTRSLGLTSEPPLYIVCSSVSLFVCLSVCLFARLSVCLFVCMPIINIFLSVNLELHSNSGTPNAPTMGQMLVLDRFLNCSTGTVGPIPIHLVQRILKKIILRPISSLPGSPSMSRRVQSLCSSWTSLSTPPSHQYGLPPSLPPFLPPSLTHILCRMGSRLLKISWTGAGVNTLILQTRCLKRRGGWQWW